MCVEVIGKDRTEPKWTKALKAGKSFECIVGYFFCISWSSYLIHPLTSFFDSFRCFISADRMVSAVESHWEEIPGVGWKPPKNHRGLKVEKHRPSQGCLEKKALKMPTVHFRICSWEHFLKTFFVVVQILETATGCSPCVAKKLLEGLLPKCMLFHLLSLSINR